MTADQSGEDTRTVAEVGEFDLIAEVTAGHPQAPGTVLGPGDDAAVLTAPDGRIVATTDVLVEGVHFRMDWSTPEHVGRKAAAVNLADVSAMGARPTGLLVGFCCPGTTRVSVLREIATGLCREASAAGAGLAGGDMVSGQQLVVSVTAFGDLGGREPVTRAGARPGDVLAVAGRLGWAAAGLAVLGRGFRSPVAVVNAQRWPEPPYAAGPQAADGGATSMIDISDGLLADSGHIAASSEVAIDIRTDQIEVPQRLVDVSSALGADPLHWILTGGEDHGLAATFPDPATVPEGWTLIGSVGRGQGVTVDGKPYERPAGWEHWR